MAVPQSPFAVTGPSVDAPSTGEATEAWNTADSDAPLVSEAARVQIQVWRGRLPARVAPDDLRILSDEESARFRAFQDPARAAWYAGAHAALRRRLAPLLDTPPETIAFGRSPCPTCGDAGHGRPRIVIPDTTVQLSLSRSGPYWLCAVADGTAVGADIEQLRPSYVQGLPEAVLSRQERAHLAAHRAEVRAVEFTRCWTRKEAVVKASGVGVATDLRRIQVRPDVPMAVVRHVGRSPGPERWLVQDLPAGEDHLAAVALAAPERELG